MFVVASGLWPSQSAITVTSFPASKRRIAQVCRSVCMVIRFAPIDGQIACASATWWASRCSTASRLSRLPVLVAKSASLLPPLAEGVHVGAAAERHVLAFEPDELGDPKPRLDRESEHRVIASAGPTLLIADREERGYLVFVEVSDEIYLGSLVRDRQDAPDRAGVLRMVQRQVGEQRMDRREARVARHRSVPPLALEMLEERRDERRVELGDVEPARRDATAS